MPLPFPYWIKSFNTVVRTGSYFISFYAIDIWLHHYVCCFNNFSTLACVFYYHVTLRPWRIMRSSFCSFFFHLLWSWFISSILNFTLGWLRFVFNPLVMAFWPKSYVFLVNCLADFIGLFGQFSTTSCTFYFKLWSFFFSNFLTVSNISSLGFYLETTSDFTGCAS